MEADTQLQQVSEEEFNLGFGILEHWSAYAIDVATIALTIIVFALTILALSKHKPNGYKLILLGFALDIISIAMSFFQEAWPYDEPMYDIWKISISSLSLVALCFIGFGVFRAWRGNVD